MQLLRQREEAALGNRLRTPRDPLAALEQLANERMRLQLLEKVVHRELDVAVVEPHDHSEREHVLAHRVDERAAELPVLRARAQRPTERVDHAIERSLHLPDFLHAERPDLWVLAREAEPIERDAGEVALRSLGEHRDLRDQIRTGLEVSERLTIAAAALVTGPNSACPAVGDEQLLRSCLRQQHRARLLGLLGEPAAEPRQRRHVVALVLHRRRRGNAQRALVRQEVDGFVLDGPVERHLVDTLTALEETPQRAWIHDGPRQKMRAGLLAFLQDRHRHFAEPLPNLGCVLEQLAKSNATRETGRPCADDEDTDVDALLGRIARRGDILRCPKRRRKVCGLGHELLRCLTSSVSFGTTSCTSPTTPRSENSKIGAFVSLLIATITPELCMPTLC